MKQKRKTEGEIYKRKSTLGGWIAFALVVAVLVVYLRKQPSSKADQAMSDPDTALKYFAEMAYKVSHFETGIGADGATIDKLLDLCVKEDREWFQNSYDRIYARGVGGTIGATNVNYMIRRNAAMKAILDEGVNRADYQLVTKEDRPGGVRYRVRIPGPFNSSREVDVELKKEKGKWKVMDLGGGKNKVL